MDTIDTTGWAVLLPRPGKRPASSARVTLAWRLNTKASSKTMTGYINVARAIAEQLGWPDKSKMVARHDPAGTMLAVRPGDAGYSMKSMNGCATFQCFLPWCEQAATRPAEPVEHRVLPGGELLILLPEWARMKRAAVPAPAVLVAAATAKPAASDVAPEPEPMLKWTPERNDVLRSMYPQGASRDAMAEAVNRLPGLPATSDQCKAQAGNLGLKRAQRIVGASAPAASPPPSLPVPVAEKPAPMPARGPDRGASLPAQSTAKDEAFEMFAAGSSARDVAAELGVPLADASNWVVEWRLKNRKTSEAA